MNTLFEFDGKLVTINPILLSISEFERLWNRDKSEDKINARKEITYIYGMCSLNTDNIWSDYLDLKEREKIIKTDLFDEDWQADEVVTRAMDKFKVRYPHSASEDLLEAMKETMVKIKDYVRAINLFEEDDQGKPKYSIKMLLDVAKQATDVYLKIEDTIEKVKQNKRVLAEKIRGGGEKGDFEDDEEDF